MSSLLTAYDMAAGEVSAHAGDLVIHAACVTIFLVAARASDRCAGILRVIASTAAMVALGAGIWLAHHLEVLKTSPGILLPLTKDDLAWSLTIAVLAFGGPLAATGLTGSLRARAILGASGGAGLVTLNFLEAVGQSGDPARLAPAVLVAPMILICALLALAMSLPRRAGYWPIAGALTLAAIVIGHQSVAEHADLSWQASQIWEANGVSRDTAFVLMLLSLGAVVLVGRYIHLDTAHRHSTLRIAEQAETLAAALHNMTNGLLMVTPDRTIRLHNDRTRELLDLDRDTIVSGMPLDDLIRKLGEHHRWSNLRTTKTIESHWKWLDKSEMTQTEFYFDNGRVLSIACCPMADGSAVITYHDVTSERRIHAEMAHMAYHDALTGLPNLRSFQQELHTALGSQVCPAVLMLDLDRYKIVNDTLGHSIGDELLVQVAQRLRDCSRPSDLVFRIGGDEFAMLPGRLERSAIVPFGERIVEALSQEFSIDGHAINIGCSVGVAFLDETSIEEAEMQIQKADLALYRAKRLGRGRVECYEEGMIEEAIEKRKLEADLLRALGAREFVLHYQPICSATDRRLLGFEALVRWRHPERGLLAPRHFIPLAEETGLIKEIGLWVLAEACREVARWPEPLHVAINVSPVQLRAPGLVAELAKSLMANRLAPGRVEVELTETALVEDGEGMAEVLRSLRDLGIKIAMNDFGTGYSSLSHLRDFELDLIKIDRSFVDRPADDFGAASVVRAVTSIARDLGITTIAVGVETSEQLQRLADLGCNGVQGFLLGRPLDRDGVQAMIFANAAREAETSIRAAG
jgi:diguanylate cyclase (GGDEF)-like protein